MRTSKKKSTSKLLSKGEKNHPPDPFRPTQKSARKDKTSPTPPSKGEKRRKVKLPEHSRLNKKLVKEFDNFIEYAPPDRLSRSLRNMFLIYLSHEQDGLPNNFKDTVIDFYLLLEFLDNIGEKHHQKQA